MTPLTRKTRLKRSGRVKPVNRKRKLSEFQRAYGSKARVAWVKTLPCCVTGCFRRDDIENAHTENGGMGRKADYATIAPLCAIHHRELHWWGQDDFQSGYQTNLRAAAARTESLWQAHLSGGSPLRPHA